MLPTAVAIASDPAKFPKVLTLQNHHGVMFLRTFPSANLLVPAFVV
jgi:hypothetical protein